MIKGGLAWANHSPTKCAQVKVKANNATSFAIRSRLTRWVSSKLKPRDFNEANKSHAITYGAILIALLDNGIVTQQQYDKARAQATHIVDEEYAKKRDKALQQKDSTK